LEAGSITVESSTVCRLENLLLEERRFKFFDGLSLRLASNVQEDGRMSLSPLLRKGARTVATVDPDVLRDLEAGTMETANLTEGLAINMRRLLAKVAPTIPADAIDLELGVVQRMAQAGALLRNYKFKFADHRSDTVRGWAAFAVGQDETLDRKDRLAAIRPFAADTHFGVREWAWMAVRAIIVAEPLMAIATLTPWAEDPDPNIRRFASEATRPRGVWAASISLLRKEPERALPLLTSLRHDTHRYVEDSVANWLNDAAKDSPDWVRVLLRTWEADGVSARLIKRAGRSL
jgi:3-methyladenine DNA glycosylase AlkC